MLPNYGRALKLHRRCGIPLRHWRSVDVPPRLQSEPREETDLLPGERHARRKADSHAQWSAFERDLWGTATHLTKLLERDGSSRNSVLIVRHEIFLHDYAVRRNQIFDRVRHSIRVQFRRHI